MISIKSKEISSKTHNKEIQKVYYFKSEFLYPTQKKQPRLTITKPYEFKYAKSGMYNKLKVFWMLTYLNGKALTILVFGYLQINVCTYSFSG